MSTYVEYYLYISIYNFKNKEFYNTNNNKRKICVHNIIYAVIYRYPYVGEL